MVKRPIDEVVGKDVSLILGDVETYQEVILGILTDLVTDKGQSGVYIALNKPYKTLKDFFEKYNVDTTKLHFVDRVSKSAKSVKNAEYIDSGHFKALNKALKKHLKNKEYSFFVFDTVDTLLLYNNKNEVLEFLTEFSAECRDIDKKCILIGIKESVVEQMLHTGIQKIADDSIDFALSKNPEFEKTFLKL